MGLKDQIFAADDLPHEDVEVPEWGVTVRVRGMTGSDRDAYEARAVAVKRGGQDVELRLQDFRSKLLVKCLYDPDTNERIFTEAEASKLGAKSGQVIERLFEIAGRLSGMADDAVEAARGNSVGGQSGSSITA